MFWGTVPVLLLLLHLNGSMCCGSHERESLLHFKASVLDPSDQILNSWHGFNCCEWNGIQCHPRTHHVIRLDLHSSRDAYIDRISLSDLAGDVLSPLFSLQHLEHLDLSWNDFYGVSIPPGLPRFKSLRYLNLSCTGFMGYVPRELGNMSSLHYLDLSDNNLTLEDMRTWRGNMRDLRELILYMVDMSGVESNELDNALSTMYSLTRLQMSGCNLSVAIPPSLANLTNLTHLQLYWNELDGSIPSALLSLPRLQLVDLSSNSHLGGNLSSIRPQHSGPLHTLDLSETSVGGSIPDSVANMSSLTVLDLSYCHAESIPITMANLTALKELDLSYSMFRGHIPPFGNKSLSFESGRPFPLTYIDISHNHFDGPIPPMLFTAFPSLQYVDLSYNQLKGSVPSPESKLDYLTHLDLSHNALTGIFSESNIDGLSQLGELDVSDNLLTVNFSPTWIPKFSLRTLGLSSCNMQSGFPTFLITQYYVETVDLSNCSIAGYIPQWIWGIDSLGYLNLSHNSFAGVLPNSLWATRTEMEILDLHSNYLQDQLPLHYDGLAVLDLSENQLSGSIPEEIGKYSLKYLSLSRNQLNGRIPPSVCRIRIVDLSNNKLTGNIHDNFKNCSPIDMLNLENNYLEGELPWWLGEIVTLRTLELSGNGLNSYIPSSLANCKLLEILDLGNNKLKGTIPNWIEKLSNLKILILRSNRFEGMIPSQVTTLPLLQILDLSSNRFSGGIPANILSLEAMKNQSATTEIFQVETFIRGVLSTPIYVDRVTITNKAQEMEYVRSLALVKCIDLSNNNLTGGIPDNVGLLHGLVVLNISRNNITGEIPKALGNMAQLQSLDISHNQLSGSIPLELQSLTFLGYLDMSHNNLSGKIPQGGQLLTFEAPSFSNNSDLCGLQLNTKCCGLHQNKSCPANVPPGTNATKTDEEEEDDVWWGVGLGMSYAVGFSIVIGVLCLTTTWSRKCFEIMDSFIVYLFTRLRK